MSKSEQATLGSDFDTEKSSRSADIFKNKLFVGAALGLVAISAYAAERFGMSEQLPDGVRQIATSLAHPFVGFAGAWAGDKLKKSSNKAMFVGATIANFAVEAAQSATVKYPGYYNFLAMGNLPETFKDYAFALSGMALYKYMKSKDK